MGEAVWSCRSSCRTFQCGTAHFHEAGGQPENLDERLDRLSEGTLRYPTSLCYQWLSQQL